MVKELLRVKYGDTTLSESAVFPGGDRQKRLNIILSVFLVVTDSRKILVDAGCETMPGFVVENFRTPMAVLAEMGYAPEEITDVIITHAHWDHMECVKYFPKAVVHLQKDEWEKGRKFLPEGFRVELFGEELTLEPGVKAVKIGGHSRGSCIVECRKEGRIYVLCGDECYTGENLRRKIPTGASCCPEKSRAFIETYSGAQYTCLLCHDQAQI